MYKFSISKLPDAKPIKMREKKSKLNSVDCESAPFSLKIANVESVTSLLKYFVKSFNNCTVSFLLLPSGPQLKQTCKY